MVSCLLSAVIMLILCTLGLGLDVMSNFPIAERAQRFLSVLRHCQLLGMRVHSAEPNGLIQL